VWRGLDARAEARAAAAFLALSDNSIREVVELLLLTAPEAQRELEAAQAALDGGLEMVTQKVNSWGGATEEVPAPKGGGPETAGGAAVEHATLAETLAALGEGGGAALEGCRGGGFRGARDGPLQSMYWAARHSNLPQLIGVHGRDPSSADEKGDWGDVSSCSRLYERLSLRPLAAPASDRLLLSALCRARR